MRVLLEINRCLLVLDHVAMMPVADEERLRRAQGAIEFRDLPVYSGELVIKVRQRILQLLEEVRRDVALRDPIAVARRRIVALAGL